MDQHTRETVAALIADIEAKVVSLPIVLEELRRLMDAGQTD